MTAAKLHGMRRPRLVIPAVLHVSTLSFACGGDDGSSDMTGTTILSSETTTAPSTETTTESTSTASTSGADSSSSNAGSTTSTTTEGTTTEGTTTDATTDGSDTGSGLPDCNAIEEPKTCNAMPGCLYDEVVGQCDVDCTLIDDMATCVDQIGVCIWVDDGCFHVAI